MKTGYNNELYYRYIKPPYESRGYTWFEADFPSPIALQSYLRSGPPINRDVFGYDLMSQSRDKHFHGEPLSTAIRYLSGGYTHNLGRLLQVKSSLDRTLPRPSPHVRYQKTQNGSRFHIPNAVAGSPKYMVKPVRKPAPTEITVHFNASYTGAASETQIFHRGLLTLSLIDLLERHHYAVTFRVFELSRTDREIIHIKLELKRHGGVMDMAVTNYIVNSKEFLRRIVFHIQETMPVNDPDWKKGYGKLFSPQEMRDLLPIPREHILIGSPKNMGIDGKSLERDSQGFFRAVQLESYL